MKKQDVLWAIEDYNMGVVVYSPWKREADRWEFRVPTSAYSRRGPRAGGLRTTGVFKAATYDQLKARISKYLGEVKFWGLNIYLRHIASSGGGGDRVCVRRANQGKPFSQAEWVEAEKYLSALEEGPEEFRALLERELETEREAVNA